MLMFVLLVLPINGAANSKLLFPLAQKNTSKVFVFNPNAEEELVIYTHDSFLAWGYNATDARYKAFEKFGELHGVSVVLREFSGMVEALNHIINQKDNPQADIVIGLDTTMVSRAKEEGVLKQITSGVNLENISSFLINALDPEKYLVPIDHSLLAFVFDTSYINATSNPTINNLNFSNLLSEFGEDLAVQDPTLSATGLNFLLYQIVYYNQFLGLDWREWWQEAKEMVTIDKSWSDSWDRVFSAKTDHIMVSYATDPAYNAFFNYSFEQNAVIINQNSQQYGWLQIEGIGIVEGTSNEALAKTYINYALSNEYQSLIPTNNWMYPANSNVTLPECYDYAIDTEGVIVLNTFADSEYIGQYYQTWLKQWERTVFSGLWWAWVLLAALIVIVGGILTITIYRQKTKLKVE